MGPRTSLGLKTLGLEILGPKFFKKKKVTKLSPKKLGPKILVQKNVVSEIWWGSYCYIGKQSQLLTRQVGVSSSIPWLIFGPKNKLNPEKIVFQKI